MKKFCFFAALMLTVVFFAGCGRNQQAQEVMDFIDQVGNILGADNEVANIVQDIAASFDETAQETGTSTTQTPAATSLALGDTINVRDWEVTFHPELEFFQVDGDGITIRDADGNLTSTNTIVRVPFTITNVSEESGNSFRYIFMGFWGPHSERMRNNDYGFLPIVDGHFIRRNINPDHTDWDWRTPIGEVITTYLHMPFAGGGEYRIGLAVRSIALADTAVYFTLEDRDFEVNTAEETILPDTDEQDNYEPDVILPPFPPIVTVSAGARFTLALTESGELWGWGNNNNGRLGHEGEEQYTSPIYIKSGVAHISAGGYHSAVICYNGTLWTWGGNDYGQLGDGTRNSSFSPLEIMNNVVYVSAGLHHTAAITGDGYLYVWGRNWDGQVGDGTDSNRHEPVRIMENIASVSAGPRNTLAITTDGVLYAWGYNDPGQIGDGTRTTRLSPVQVNENIAMVSSGLFTMAVNNEGTLWSWGRGNEGQMGNGRTTTRQLTPVRTMDNIALVSTFGFTAMAIRDDGSLWMWGYNRYGQIGDGSTSTRSNPVRILDNVAYASTSSWHTVAILYDGSVYVWGMNDRGQLGNGTTTNQTSPVRVN